MVVKNAVFEQVIDREFVTVAIQTALQVGKLADGILEDFRDVVVELFGERFGMHGHDGFFRIGRKIRQFLLDEMEIGYGFRMVEFECVGVQADESDFSGRECVIGRAEDHAENRLSGCQTIVVPQNGDIGDVQFVENVALSFEFGAHAEIGEVARVDDEIEPVAVVECFDRLFRFVIPLLRIGNDSETNRLDRKSTRLNSSHRQ